jgi:hypothetical protein
MCIKFVTGYHLTKAISQNDTSCLNGVHIWSYEDILRPVVVRVHGQVHCKTSLEIAAEHAPEVFDVIWTKIEPDLLNNEDMIGCIVSFIRFRDYDRFLEIWDNLDVRKLDPSTRMYILNVAREPIKNDHRKIAMDVDGNFDTSDKILRICWYRLNYGLNMERWIRGDDEAYMLFLLNE